MKENIPITIPSNGYEEWQNNTEIFQVNRLDAHATTVSFASLEEALSIHRMKSSRIQLLNGDWDFTMVDKPADRINNYYSSKFDRSNWSKMLVPGHWQLNGFDAPQYVNVKYPWIDKENVEEGFAPVTFNPIGYYHHEFTVTKGWKEQPIHICFQGVESAFYLYVNGQFVGYSEDSFSPSEFDLTPFLVDGVNSIDMEVFKWCDASWLEDQDFWRFSGIFRDVYLYTMKDVSIWDYFVRTDLSDDYTSSTVKVSSTFLNYQCKHTEPIHASVILFEQDKLLSRHILVDNQVLNQELTDMSIDFQVLNPKLWSAEQPNLYRLVFEVTDAHRNVIEYRCTNIGFREFMLDDSIMKLNGQRIVFKGANRHEFHPAKGRVISYEDMEKDIQGFKRNNLNALRTSHYPNNPYLYELCDSYGLYVIDEANIETHGTWDYKRRNEYQEKAIPGSKERWTGAVMDRINSMFQRDKNHPCILIWSLGNESYGGTNFVKMHDFLAEQDTTRLVHYEGTFHDRTFDDASDIESHMYTKPSEIEAYATGNNKKPLILCEYAHAMGESCGNLKKYTDLFHKYPILQGGFIWDWIDQALYKTDATGKKFLAYGGDFGDSPNDNFFCGNGLLLADGTETPKLTEVKTCYANIEFSAIDIEQNKFLIKNHFLFTDLKAYDFKWSVTVNGAVVSEGAFDVHLEPTSELTMFIPYKQVDHLHENDICYLTLSAHEKAMTQWADKGHEIAFRQFRLQAKETKLSNGHHKKNPISLLEIDSLIVVRTGKVEIQFNQTSGFIERYIFDDMKVLNQPLMPNYWRAPIDNDLGSQINEIVEPWNKAMHNIVLNDLSYQQEEGRFIINALHTIGKPALAKLRMTYIVDVYGTLTIQHNMTPFDHAPVIPAVGMQLILPDIWKEFEYLGKGPESNYIDRNTGVKFGLYKSNVESEWFPYIRPQECANKTDVYRVDFFNDSGDKLTINASEPFEMIVGGFTPQEISSYSHPHLMPKISKTVLRINQCQMGIGGDDSWNSTMHDEYKLYPNRSYNYSFFVTCE